MHLPLGLPSHLSSLLPFLNDNTKKRYKATETSHKKFCEENKHMYTCEEHIENFGDWWLSGCRGSVAAQARHVLSLTPGDCTSHPFHFVPHNINILILLPALVRCSKHLG